MYSTTPLYSRDSALQLSSNSWTEKEKNKLIDLEKDPSRSWKDIANKFHNKKYQECKDCWKEIFKQILFPEKEVEHKTYIAQKKWTQEEKDQLLELKTKYPRLAFARIAVRLNKTEAKCRDQWKILSRKSNQSQETANEVATSKSEEQINLEELIQLEQKSLSWKEIATFFPNTTDQDCRELWQEKVLQPYIDQKQQQKKEPVVWTQKQEEEISDLREKFPHLTRERLAIRINKTPQQYQGWVRKRNQTAEKSNSSHVSKKQRTENSSLSYRFNPYLVNLPSLEDIEKTLDPLLYSYGLAVTHFKEMQVMDPMLAGYQEDLLFLANIQTTYEEIKQKLKEKECSEEIMQKISDINQVVNRCPLRTYRIEFLYQHFSSYQIDPQDKEWFISQGQEFGTLYLNFLTGAINETSFSQQILLKTRDYCYQKSKSVFKILEKSLQSHCYKLTSKYQNHITNLFNSINYNSELLKTDPNWVLIIFVLTKTSERLQEIEHFFQTTTIFSLPLLDKLNETESNIIAWINDEISSEDFHIRQAAIEKIEVMLMQSLPQEFDDYFNT